MATDGEAAGGTLFLKAGCPHCLKLRLFLLEAGLSGDFAVREFATGDVEEAAIRTELAAHLDRVSFPAVRFADGEYLRESDAIIARVAASAGVDRARLPVFAAYADHVLPRYMALRQAAKQAG